MKKITRLTFTITVLFVFGSGFAAFAFHSGGVGHCDGCHTMHNSQGGSVSSWLLPGADSSSICLNCHGGAGSPNTPHIASNDGSAMTPGGDFYWVNKDFFWAGGSSSGDSHGHNIIAQDFGFTVDARLPYSPGGNYPANALTCTSCHDPHGKTGATLPISGSGSYGGSSVPGTVLGNYRLLGSSQYDGGQHVQGYAFTRDAPVARGNPLAPYGETDASHIDYGSGMSEWCANCHEDILTREHETYAPTFGLQHPMGIDKGRLGGDQILWYNTYVKTGDFSGIKAFAYLSLVPFERGETDPALLNPTRTDGPDSNSNVMCLTCHRAHSTAFRSIGRWDFDVLLISDSHPANGDSGVTGNDVFYSYYGRDMLSEFGPDQKILCEKCHEYPKQ